LKGNGIADYGELATGTDAAVERSHKLAAELVQNTIIFARRLSMVSAKAGTVFWMACVSFLALFFSSRCRALSALNSPEVNPRFSPLRMR
jgi:hypothetical protein